MEEFLEENADDLANVAATIRSAINTARRNLEWTSSVKTEITTWFSSTFSGGNHLVGASRILVVIIAISAALLAV